MSTTIKGSRILCRARDALRRLAALSAEPVRRHRNGSADGPSEPGLRAGAKRPQTTIALDAAHLGPLRCALLTMLSATTGRLDAACGRAGRERRPERTRAAYAHLLRIGSALDAIGWGAPDSADRAELEIATQVPVALAALRNHVRDARDVVEDARSFGRRCALRDATMRLYSAYAALLSVELAATRHGFPLWGSGGGEQSEGAEALDRAVAEHREILDADGELDEGGGGGCPAPR